MFIIGLLIILIDQTIKAIVCMNIPYGTSIGSFIKITNIQNTGMAYGMRKKSPNNYNNSKYYNFMYIVIFSNKKFQKHA